MDQKDKAILLGQLAPKVPPESAIYNLETVCERTGLDWLQRHVYLIERGGKWRVELSIDGFRALAGEHGEDGPYWSTGPDGPWTDIPPAGEPYACKLGVVIGPYTTWGIVRYADYAAGPMWKKMPSTMIAKCAEMVALRKALPHKLGGLYGTEEMEQADYVPSTKLPRAAKVTVPLAVTPTTNVGISTGVLNTISSNTATANISPYLEMIKNAPSLQDLRTVGDDIRKSSLDLVERGRLSIAYEEKKKVEGWR